MKLKEYLENLNQFIAENPEALNLDVITSKDDEGNGYNAVYYTPTAGILDGDDFIPSDQLNEFDKSIDDINVVCIN